MGVYAYSFIFPMGAIMVMDEEKKVNKKAIYITLAVIVSMLIIILGLFINKNEINKSKEEAKKDVTAIGELKTNQIANWYKERIDEIEIISISPFLSLTIEKMLKDKKNSIDKDKVFTLLKAHKREIHFDDILLSTSDGEIILGTNPEIKEFTPLLLSKIKLAVKNKSLQTTDIYYNEYLNKAVMDFFSPILNEEKDIIAVLIFRINLENYLYPFLQYWLPTVKTFETLLVEREGDSAVFLNELKFKKHTASEMKYSLKKPDILAVKAVTGYKGIFEGNDYRGVPVISYISHVPGTKWYLVTKINKSELLKDSMRKSVTIIFFMALFVISINLFFIHLYNVMQKKVYKQKFEAKQEFETTLYSIGDAVITTDKSGMIKYMNPIAESMTGWTEMEARGNNIEDVFKIINEETRAKVENPVERVLREGIVVGLANHTLLISKDGIEIPIADSGAPIKGEDGEIVGVVLVFRDQSDERAIQKALVESEEKFRQIFESANVGKSITALSGKINVNKAFCDMLGYSKEELKGKTWQELTPPEDIEIISGYIAPLLEGKSDSARFEKRYIHKNGSYIWCDVSIALRRDVNGKPLHYITTIVDINEKRKIEIEKQLFSKVLENTKNEIYIFDDKNLKFCNVNLGARENLGYTLDELRSLTPLDLKPEFTEQKFREMIKPLLAKEIDRLVFETVHKRKDGSLYPVEVFLYYRKTEGMFAAIINDITERKRNEEALKKSEVFFRTTLYSIGDAVITTDTNGRIMQLNPVSEELTGWKEEDAKGKLLDEVFVIVSETDRSKVESPVVKVLREGLVVGLANHTLLISKDGREIPIADSGAPIKDEEGQTIGVVLVFRDQTEERHTQKIMNARLKIVEQEKNKSLHDIFQSTIDEIEKLVDSSIGFYHKLLPDEETLGLQVWSTRTEKEFCKTDGNGLHYNIKEAGLWADCVRQRKPVIQNNYELLPHKKGLPEGHVPIIRELVVPIIRENKIVAVLGVGNKPSFYTQKDLETVSFLADVLWEVAEKKIDELKIIESEERYRKLVEISPDGIIVHQSGVIKYANQSAARIAGYESSAELVGKNAIEFVHPDYRDIAIRRIQEAIVKGGVAVPLEEKFIRKDGDLLDVEVTAIPFHLNDEPAMQTIIRDISERKKKDAELFEAKEILEKIYLGIDDGIVIIDSKTKDITGCNYAAEKIFRYPYKEILGKHISILMKESGQINFNEIGKRFLSGEDKDNKEVTGILQRKDNLLFPATYTVFPLLDRKDKIIRYVLIVRDITDAVKREQEMKLINQRLKTYATHLQSVREEERTSIAREIHDEIGQALSVMNMNLSIIERDYLVNPESFNIEAIRQEIISMKDFIIKTVKKMRKVIMNLRPEIIEDLDIAEAIEWLVNEFRKDNNIDCKFSKKVETIKISKDKTISLFRILQEALRNIARHAEATRAEITISRSKDTYELSVTDNGKGFNLNEVNYKKSFGIMGMRERTEILEGEIEILTEVNKGTKIVVKFQ